MKRIHPSWWMRLTKAAKPARNTLAICSGSAATVLGIAAGFGVVMPFNMIYLAIGWCIGPPVGVLIWKSRSQHLPDLVVDDGNPDRAYTFRYCTAGDLREANAWTRPYYRHEYVADDVAESWRAKAPKSFVGVFNADGLLCAAFGIIAIENAFMTMFIKGRIQDTSLKPEDILSDEEAPKSPHLYISGVVVRDPDSFLGRKRACAMFWGMAKFVEHRYRGKRKRTLYALAVSPPSKRWLHRAGFARSSGPDGRVDKLELYSLPVTKARIDAIVREVGEYSGQCSLELN